MRQLKVLMINAGNSYGGVSNLLATIALESKKDEIVFDFLSPHKTTYGPHENKLREKGSSIYELGIKDNIISRKTQLIPKFISFYKSHKNTYDIIHINSGAIIFNFAISLAIKIINKKQLIVLHNHGNYPLSYKRLFKPALLSLGDVFIACSKQSADSMFQIRKQQENIHILLNGIDIKKFIFSIEKRNSLRKKWELESCTIYGHIARLVPCKNQLFLLDVFAKIHEKQPNSALVIVGDGPMRAQLIKKINKLHLQDSILLEGYRDNVSDYLSSFDFFILPSTSEGLGISLVEAQCSGLECFVSQRIPNEAKINSSIVTSIDINKGADYWADTIIKHKKRANRERLSAAKIIAESNFNIKKTTNYLLRIYRGAINNRD